MFIFVTVMICFYTAVGLLRSKRKYLFSHDNPSNFLFIFCHKSDTPLLLPVCQYLDLCENTYTNIYSYSCQEKGSP